MRWLPRATTATSPVRSTPVDFLNAGEAAARAVAQRRGLAYVVACAGLPELAPKADLGPRLLCRPVDGTFALALAAPAVDCE